MDNESICFKSAKELAHLIRSRKLKSVQVVQAHLQRIHKYNPQINAVVSLRENEALREAEAADLALDVAISKGASVGPLHGVPMTIKDAFRIQGTRSTFGALPQYWSHSPQTDCELVRRLKNSGAIILGRSNLPLLSFDWQCRNPLFKEGTNPWNLDHTPGGSSGGSAAALASRFSPLELGSDIAGSIRYPAHCCGVLGLRPTEGFLPIDDIGPEDVSHVFQRIISCGPMARSIDDLDLMLQVLASRPKPEKTSDRKLKIVMSSSNLKMIPNKKTVSLLEDLCKKLQADGHEVQIDKDLPIDFQHAYQIWGMIAGYEFKSFLPKFFQVTPGRSLFQFYMFHFKLGNGPLTRFVKKGFSATQAEYQKALHEREKYFETMDTFFKQTDLWILPVSPSEAIPRQRWGRSISVDGKKIPYSEYLGSYLAPTALLGTPALSLPIGFGETGLPIGIQVHGARNSDFDLLAKAKLHLEKYVEVGVPPRFNVCSSR